MSVEALENSFFQKSYVKDFGLAQRIKEGTILDRSFTTALQLCKSTTALLKAPAQPKIACSPGATKDSIANEAAADYAAEASQHTYESNCAAQENAPPNGTFGEQPDGS